MFIFLKKKDLEKNFEDIRKIENKHKLKIFQNDTVYILYKDINLISLPNNKIVLYESLFSKTHFSSVPLEILKSVSSLDLFINAFYGSYIWIEYVNNSFKIYRDISGQTTIFYTLSNEIEIYFSDVFLRYQLLKKRPEFNMAYFQKFVLEGNFLSESTPYNGVNEIAPGWQIRYNQEKPIHEPIWLTRLFSSPFIEKKDLEEKLIASLVGVISNQIKNLDNIVVDCSGGVDSTGLVLLVNAIKNKDQNVVAAHYYYPKVQSSCELEYVQEIVDSLKMPLIKIEYSKNDLPFTPKDTSSKKINYISTMLLHGRNEETIDKYIKPEQKTFISGHGGDHIFCCPPISLSLLDRTYLFHPLKTFQFFKEFSIYNGAPLLRIILFLLRNILRSRDKAPPTSNLFTKFNSELCPSLNLNLRILPGKKDHIRLLHDALADIRYNVRNKSSILYPLLQEPIIELALKFRTFDLFQNGLDRFPYRKAIADNFGCFQALKRQTKGETSGVIFEGLVSNKKTIEDYLFNGIISQSGSINKPRLQILFQDALNGVLRDNELNEIMNLWNVEEFYRSWN